MARIVNRIREEKEPRGPWQPARWYMPGTQARTRKGFLFEVRPAEYWREECWALVGESR